MWTWPHAYVHMCGWYIHITTFIQNYSYNSISIYVSTMIIRIIRTITITIIIIVMYIYIYICACISEYTVYIYTYYRNSMKQWHLATSWPGRGRNPCGSERAKTRQSEGSGPWRDPVDGKSKRVQTENQLKTLQRKFKTCNCISIDV